MNDEKLLEKFALICTTVMQLEECVILQYALTPEKNETTKNECIKFIGLCKTFDQIFNGEKKARASHETLAKALDITLAARECIKNESVFNQQLEKIIISTSTDIIIAGIKVLAIELDRRLK